MRTLVIDTVTAACSVALFDDETPVAERHDVVGRGHAERLIPMIGDLPARGRADSIVVDCGPGSFTGLRVGLATARALGLAWNADCFGYSSLALMAAAEFDRTDTPDKLAVAIFGGHGEVFIERFEKSPFRSRAPLASMTPEAAARSIGEPLLIGDAAAELARFCDAGEIREALPRAATLFGLPEPFRRLPPTPIYGRAPDAKPPA